MEKPARILLVDDNRAIHEDFYKSFANNHNHYSVSDDEAILFDIEPEARKPHYAPNYQIDSAFQGQEALKLVRNAVSSNSPYALAFIDMRMPPGWDGIETIKHIWTVDPQIQVVICTAYSDHSWEEITAQLGASDNLLILKKPFEIIEINQIATAMIKKWELIARLNDLVEARTNEMEKIFSVTQATLEATQEGILAVDQDGKITLYNNNFLELWGITKEAFPSLHSRDLFYQLSCQVENSALFVSMMNDLAISPKTRNPKEWQLKNTTILELYAKPNYIKENVAGIVYSFRDVTDRKELEKQLLHQATHDLLTGLPNRALLHDRLNQAINHAKRFNLQVAVLLLDLNGFKEVNDTFGHNTGDILLQKLAKRLENFIQIHDTIARFGGDEFIILLAAQQNEQQIITRLNRLIELFQTPFEVDDHELMISASVGVSVYPRDSNNATTLLRNADAALYYAKESGEHFYQFYRESFNQELIERLQLKLALGNALPNNQLFLHYQPLYDLNTDSIIGMEALLRWEHPAMGCVSPSLFIPLAEESSLIITIGEWVLRTACTQMQHWNSQRATPLKISVNISVKQFRHRNFLALVKRILKETKIAPHCLELEITESLILGGISETLEKMLALKSLGVRFAIDDFGMGYSSLSYLKHFPFNTVKIDKSFIDNVTHDPNDAYIVEAIISMTKNMHIDVLAEGVEKAEQVAYLRAHHSDQVQGYYFSKPLSTEESTQLLSKNESNFKDIA